MSEELEWQTRRERINTKLSSLPQPWKIVRYTENVKPSSLINHAVEEYPTENGPADYAFFVKGKLLGIMEAKKVGLDPQNVLEQAKRYSKGVKDGLGKWVNYGVPLLYSTNGGRFTSSTCGKRRTCRARYLHTQPLMHWPRSMNVGR